jgi:hypothetical protein
MLPKLKEYGLMQLKSSICIKRIGDEMYKKLVLLNNDDQYEDPRVVVGPLGQVVVVCTRFKDQKSRMCLVYLDKERLTMEKQIEFESPQNQKNWMIRPHQDPSATTFELVVQIFPEKVIEVPWEPFFDLLGDICYRVPDVDNLEWCGSSPFRQSPWGLVAIVHKKHPKNIRNKFRPEYTYGIYSSREKRILHEFQIDSTDGFTFITDFFMINHKIDHEMNHKVLRLLAGRLDCYSVSMDLDVSLLNQTK